MRVDKEVYGGLPVVMLPEGNKLYTDDLICWLEDNRNQLASLLVEAGAFLFRGFDVTAEQFESVARSGTPDLVLYTGGGSPRTHIGGKIYTSTEYTAEREIPLHCEATYFQKPPEFIWFYCQQVANTQGETPLGDMRQVFSRLDSEIIEVFQGKGVQYIYNLHNGNGFGRGWRQAFNTDDRDEVEQWLNSIESSYSWMSDGTLSVRLIAPAIRKHGGAGFEVWGNQAVNWHVCSQGERMAAAIKQLYKDVYRYPKHALFGDGSVIPDSYIKSISMTLSRAETTFCWQEGDILLCDNQFIAHGRRPYTGNRRVLVAMS